MTTSISSCNKNNLKARILTAIVLIPIIFLGIIFLPDISFGIISAFVILFAGSEWPKLMGKHSLYDKMAFICGLIFFMAIGLFLIQITGHDGWVSRTLFSLALLLWIAFFYWVSYYEYYGQMLTQNHFVIGLLGFLILVMCWLGLNIVRNVEYGKFFILYLLLLIWGVDTAAYFSGRCWGKTKLAPRVSPNKSWAGVWGALIFSLIFALIAAVSFPLDFKQRVSLIPLSIIVTIFSIIGDLTISVFKRQQKIKDTSSLLPGHGGLLDRIDSLMAAAPIFALGLLLLGLQQ